MQDISIIDVVVVLVVVCLPKPNKPPSPNLGYQYNQDTYIHYISDRSRRARATALDSRRGNNGKAMICVPTCPNSPHFFPYPMSPSVPLSLNLKPASHSLQHSPRCLQTRLGGPSELLSASASSYTHSTRTFEISFVFLLILLWYSAAPESKSRLLASSPCV